MGKAAKRKWKGGGRVEDKSSQEKNHGERFGSLEERKRNTGNTGAKKGPRGLGTKFFGRPNRRNGKKKTKGNLQQKGVVSILGHGLAKGTAVGVASGDVPSTKKTNHEKEGDGPGG